ncbi:MAG: FAD-dependent oxidoreductase [Caldilineaceae bacterium]
MHKRELLKLMGLVLLGGIVSRPSNLNNTAVAAAVAKKKILVIGAGLAGLTAASELQKQGHDLLVVEARERSGGRIWTSTKWNDAPVDLGASWIHGVDGNPLTTLAQQSHAEFRLTNYASAITYSTTGQPLSAQAEARLAQLQSKVDSALTQAQQAAQDLSVDAVIAAAFKADNLSADDQRLLNFILNSTLEAEYAGSTRELSAQWYDDAAAFSGDDGIFVNGYRLLVDYLSNGLAINLSEIVQAIDWSGAQVRVRTDKAEYLADQVIITLPLGVLKAGKVTFTPLLPQAKQNAIDQLGMGVLNKCYLRFAAAFWPTDVDWLEYVAAQRGEWTEWVSLMRTHGLPVLLGFNAADQGRAIEAWTDAQIVASAMQTLRTIYGNAIPDPLDYQITRWASDPYALGSYSFNGVGYTPALRTELAKPLGQTVFFAGEATEPQHFSSAHGAYLSGQRVAKEILDLTGQTLLYLPTVSR